MSFTKSILAAAATLILGAAGSARAQTCTSDKDCPQGFGCNVTTVVAPEPSCAPGTKCAQPDASPTPQQVMTCGPRSCNADADCGAGMVCYEQKTMACSGGTAVACPSNMPCDAAPPKPPECTTTSTKICAFKWQLPCNQDSDCGYGFLCKPTESGSCTGSGGSNEGGGSTGSGGATRPDPGFAPPPTDAGAAPPPMPPMCMTMTSYPGYCQPRVTTCTADSDCPANWKCGSAYDTPVSSDPPPGSGGAAPRPAGVDASAPPPKMCYSELSPPVRGKDETATGGGPGTMSGNGGTAPIAPPSPHADAGTSSSATKSSGCAMGGTSSSALSLLLVAFVALLRRRRR